MGIRYFFPVKWFKQVRGPAAKQANMQTSSSFVRPVLHVICQNTPESSTIVRYQFLLSCEYMALLTKDVLPRELT